MRAYRLVVISKYKPGDGVVCAVLTFEVAESETSAGLHAAWRKGFFRLISMTAISVPVRFEVGERSVQVVQLLHGSLHRPTSATMKCNIFATAP
jgi:hypothetical protein